MRALVYVSCAAGLMLGCGGGEDAKREAVFPVTGRITQHGAPLEGAMVSFAPKSQQPTAVGRTNADGEFTLTTYEAGDGAAAGDYAVVVTKVVASDAAGADAAHSADPSADISAGHGEGAGPSGVVMVQPKYGNANETPLSATVKETGENRFEFPVE